VNSKAEALKMRTHAFFIRVIEFCRTVPRSRDGDSICAQLIDSAGSAESNYRACCKGRSRKEFISKIGIAAEEADESLGWLRALRDAGLGDENELRELVREANELTAIFVASGKTAKDRLTAAEAEERLAKRRRARR
jgi:four helix bundle protein